MRISELLPVDVSPQLGADVADVLAQFLVHPRKNLDIQAGPMAVRIIVAFAVLEHKGTLEAFKKELLKYGY